MKQILVVDDSKIITQTLKNIIEEKLKHKCKVASSMKEAKELLEKYNNNFEVALLDLGLPDAPNGEVIDLVEQTGIPIIVLTGSIESEAKFREKNIVDYVIKDGAYSILYALNITNQLIKNKDIKVLVVDDSKVFVEKITDLLIRYNLQVFKAYDGIEALKVIENNPDIKIVFTDYMMPNMDGIGLTRELRKKYKKNQLSIIVSSSATDKNSASRFLKYGADDFIDKGFTKEEFYTRLNSNLEILSLFDDLENESEKNREKDKMLFNQSKMAAMGELLHNISHHWRQPLNVISTISGSLLANKDFGITDEKKELEGLESITKTTQNLSKTIEDFVNFFKKGDSEINLNLNKEITTYIQLVKPSFEDLNTKIDFLSTNEFEILANPQVIDQILLNLFNNSKEIFENSQNSTQNIITVELIENSKFIVLKYSDNGGGINKDIIERVFEPYFTTKHQDYGKGMGLYITKELIEKQLNGIIGVKNIEINNQKGAQFTIFIPNKK